MEVVLPLRYEIGESSVLFVGQVVQQGLVISRALTVVDCAPCLSAFLSDLLLSFLEGRFVHGHSLDGNRCVFTLTVAHFKMDNAEG